MRFVTLLLAVSSLGSVSTAGTEQVWIVDGFDRPGSDFTTIQAAVDAATDGDVILVRESAYVYDGFEIDDKALVITADANDRIRFPYRAGNKIRISNLSAGKTVQLNGLGRNIVELNLFSELSVASRGGPELILENNNGVVWLESCAFKGATSGPPAEPSGPGVSASDCADVVVVDCSIWGLVGLDAVNSTFHLFDTEIIGLVGAEPVPGMKLSSSAAVVSGGNVTGSQSVVDFPNIPCMTNTGDGILLEDGSALFVQDTVIEPGSHSQLFYGLCKLENSVGPIGDPIRANGDSTTSTLSGSGPRIASAALAREGRPLVRTVSGSPGDQIFLLSTTSPFVAFQPLVNGTALVGTNVTADYLGQVDGSGQLVSETLVPNLGPSIALAQLYEQVIAVALTGSKSLLAGNAAATVLLDDAVPVAPRNDCNYNGFEDDDDIRFGTSRDCNLNGIPDECERFAVTERRRLEGSTVNGGDQFGFSMAVEDGTLAVGAPYDDYQSTPDKGTVWVFSNQNGGWTQTQRIRLTADDGGGDFGSSVAFGDGYLVIGAPGRFDGGRETGAVYVYEFLDGQWTQVVRLIEDADGYARRMGQVVSIVDGVIAATARQGTVVLFENVDGTWQEQAVLPPPTPSPPTTPDPADEAPMLREGNLLVVGRPYAQNGRGAVHVYQRTGSDWSIVNTLLPPTNEQAGLFGTSLSWTADTLFVGSSDRSLVEQTSGVVYAYERLADGTVNTSASPSRLFAKDGARRDRLGSTTTATSDLLFVGGHRLAEDADMYVHGFARQPSLSWGPIETISFRASDSTFGDDFGASVLVHGSTLFVGAPRARTPGAMGNREGAVYVFDIGDLIPNPCGPVPMEDVRGRGPSAR